MIDLATPRPPSRVVVRAYSTVSYLLCFLQPRKIGLKRIVVYAGHPHITSFCVVQVVAAIRQSLGGRGVYVLIRLSFPLSPLGESLS